MQWPHKEYLNMVYDCDILGHFWDVFNYKQLITD